MANVPLSCKNSEIGPVSIPIFSIARNRGSIHERLDSKTTLRNRISVFKILSMILQRNGEGSFDLHFLYKNF
ncbi:hypothetical protein DLM75_01415 [Leptospira stimsonii]|uniref:Uncharacterized protein n=1 Tax=Leptospira stimsonii TaxID=2202203 RepID=A0A396ZDZ1_9LEPT|nr:hypothetical protein DLM75_01415 [Leptospira stimsonii]